MKSYDLSFIDLYAPQDEPKRDNVLYLEFPSTWENQDIFDLFSPFGSVHIGWINDTSAFVAIQNHDNVKKAASQLVGVSGRDYKCYFYSTYVKMLSKPKPPVGPTNTSVGNTASEKPRNGSTANTPNNDKRKRSPDKEITPSKIQINESEDIDDDVSSGKKKIKKT